MPIQEKCRILEHQQIAPQHYKLTLASTYISSNAQPGQFVQVRVSPEFDPLLRRPLSIHRCSAQHKKFELLYEVIGKGTELCQRVGSIDILDDQRVYNRPSDPSWSVAMGAALYVPAER